MGAEAKTSQLSTTVDRAGELLHLLALSPEGLGINQLSRDLDTQRAPIGRILQALMRHRLVHRDANKRYFLGVGTLELANAYTSRFPSGLESVLATLADETDMTAMLIEAEGEEMTTVLAKPPSSSAVHVFTPPGFRHPPGPLSMRTALAAAQPARADDSEEVRKARERGFAVGRGNTVPGRYGAAAVVPGTVAKGAPLILVLVAFDDFDQEAIREPLLRAATTIAYSMSP
ncbi:helix-turn-helix domain-containing protein [Paenarthrobacter nitroguajacolicus]